MNLNEFIEDKLKNIQISEHNYISDNCQMCKEVKELIRETAKATIEMVRPEEKQ